MPKKNVRPRSPSPQQLAYDPLNTPPWGDDRDNDDWAPRVLSRPDGWPVRDDGSVCEISKDKEERWTIEYWCGGCGHMAAAENGFVCRRKGCRKPEPRASSTTPASEFSYPLPCVRCREHPRLYVYSKHRKKFGICAEAISSFVENSPWLPRDYALGNAGVKETWSTGNYGKCDACALAVAIVNGRNCEE